MEFSLIVSSFLDRVDVGCYCAEEEDGGWDEDGEQEDCSFREGFVCGD